jgi:hypothetical protein
MQVSSDSVTDSDSRFRFRFWSTVTRAVTSYGAVTCVRGTDRGVRAEPEAESRVAAGCEIILRCRLNTRRCRRCSSYSTYGGGAEPLSMKNHSNAMHQYISHGDRSVRRAAFTAASEQRLLIRRVATSAMRRCRRLWYIDCQHQLQD